MKLSLDEYIWIISGEIFASMSSEENSKYDELYKVNKEKTSEYLDTLQDKYAKKYSYIEIIDLEYEILEIDLEKSYITYKAIIKLRDKYYSFEYDYSPYWDYETQYEGISELKEVFPHTETITEYY